MEKTVNRQLLKYAVQRAITCPFTGEVLDVRRAVSFSLVSEDGSATEYVTTAKAWDKGRAGIEQMAADKGWTVEVLDGRELY